MPSRLEQFPEMEYSELLEGIELNPKHSDMACFQRPMHDISLLIRNEGSVDRQL